MKPLLTTAEFWLGVCIVVAIFAAIGIAFARWREWFKQVQMNVDRPPSETATRGSQQDFNREMRK